MKKIFQLFPLMLLVMITLSGCEIIGDIFQAGMWVGVIIVVAIIAIVIWVINRFRK